MTPSLKSAIVERRDPRILVRSTNWIGDAVMSMPAVQRLRELKPDAHIALLCPAKLHDLWRHNPFVNEVIAFDKEADHKALRAARYDLALIFPNSFRSAWECWRAGIPSRVGFHGHWREWLLTDIAHEPKGDTARYKTVTVAGKTFQIKEFPAVRHQVHHYLALIAFLHGNREPVAPKIWLGPEPPTTIADFSPDDPRPLIGVAAGAEFGPAKRWPPDRFTEVILGASERIPCRWLLFGGPGDVAVAEQIVASTRKSGSFSGKILNLAGKTTLLELCHLLQKCQLLLTNDTGTMHVAAALGTPLVAIFGSTSPELTGPLGERCTIIRQPVECSPCFLRECPIDFRCMERVTVQQVAQTLLHQLNS